MRPGQLVAVCTAAVLVTLVACNQIIGNDPWTASAPDASTVDCAWRCNGLCADLTNDLRNCGACGHDCTGLPHVAGAGVACVSGQCQVPRIACQSGYAHCTINPDDGCETRLGQQSACNDCNDRCSGGKPYCQQDGNGQHACVSGCSGSTPVPCDGTCVNPTADPVHCGACDNACPAPFSGGKATCSNSTCGIACDQGFHACGATTCARDDDATQCGATCKVCPGVANGTPVCANGSCGIKCDVGRHQCTTTGACERDDDATNCGANCTSCPAPPNGKAVCTGGACDIECTAPYSKCNGACVNLLANDAANCGACGHSCLGGACAAGKCQPVSLAQSRSDFVGSKGLVIVGNKLFGTNQGGTKSGGGRVFQVNTDGSGLQVIVPSGASGTLALQNVCDLLAFDGSTFAWHAKDARIASADISGTLLPYLGSAADLAALAMDVPGQPNIYWATTTDQDGVWQATKAGQPAVQCFSGTTFAAIATDASGVYMLGQDGTLVKSPLGLTACNYIVVGRGTGPGGGVALAASFAYWSDATGKKVYRAPLNGSGPTTEITKNVTLADPPSLIAVDGTRVFLADPGSTTIWAINADGSSTTATVMASGQQNPLAIVVDANAVYWTTGAGPNVLMKVAK